MAGAYPDPPGPRMAIDRDGTTFVLVNHNTATVTAQTDPVVANSEHGGGQSVSMAGAPAQFSVVMIFPEPRDLAGAYHCLRVHLDTSSSPFNYHGFEWSANTTNGLDGTWTNLGAYGLSTSSGSGGGSTVTAMESDKQRFRNNITAHAVTGAIAVRWRITFNWGTGALMRLRAHVYGEPSTGAAPNRLQFWDPSTAVEVGGAFFDWGDVARSTALTKTFRIHNPSATLTANSVAVSMEALTDGSPSNTGQHEFSTDDGATWATTATLGDLAPGASSGVIALRRVTSGNAALGLWWTRLVASASSWT